MLRGHETIFHGMSHANGRRQVHDARRSFQGVRRSHERFQLLRRAATPLELQQSGRERTGLALRLHAEQLQHGEIAQVVGHNE